MKTNHLFLALICPGIAQETHYQRPPAVIEEVALAKLSPIIRISDNNQWALQLERSPYRSIAKLAQPELKLAGMRISPETFNTSRQAEYTGASLMNIATQEEIKIEGIPDNAVITEASFSPSSNKVALFVEEANGGKVGFHGAGRLASILQVQHIAYQMLAADVFQLLQMVFCGEVSTEPFTRLIVALLGAKAALPVMPRQLV